MPTEIKFYSDLAMAYCPLKFYFVQFLLHTFYVGNWQLWITCFIKKENVKTETFVYIWIGNL